MCVAVPMLVKEIVDGRAVLESDGVIVEANVSLIEQARAGDYLLVHAGFAIARIEPAEAEEILAMVGSLCSKGAPL